MHFTPWETRPQIKWVQKSHQCGPRKVWIRKLWAFSTSGVAKGCPRDADEVAECGGSGDVGVCGLTQPSRLTGRVEARVRWWTFPPPINFRRRVSLSSLTLLSDWRLLRLAWPLLLPLLPAVAKLLMSCFECSILGGFGNGREVLRA